MKPEITKSMYAHEALDISLELVIIKIIYKLQELQSALVEKKEEYEFYSFKSEDHAEQLSLAKKIVLQLEYIVIVDELLNKLSECESVQKIKDMVNECLSNLQIGYESDESRSIDWGKLRRMLRERSTNILSARFYMKCLEMIDQALP